MLLYFLYGLAFEGLGLAAYLQLRREGDFPLKKELVWLAAFGFVGGAAGWVDMFLASGSLHEIEHILNSCASLSPSDDRFAVAAFWMGDV